MKSFAHFSRDRMYRYSLTREWGAGNALVVIGLNPSTADEKVNDPTIRRCIAFAQREGCGSLIMLNLFGLRSTNPHVLITHREPIGRTNDAVIAEVVSQHSNVVAAWGAHAGDFPMRVKAVRALLSADVRCFGLTKGGHPRHPLYVHGSTPLVPLNGVHA